MKKSKQDKNQTDPYSEYMQVCQVCWTKDPQDKLKSTRPKEVDLQRKKILELHPCSVCKAEVHKLCYDPSLHPTSSWKCDFCKSQKTKNAKQECFICKCQGKMLKLIDDGKYAHVQCALSSDMTILQNFKTLKFKLNPQFKQKDSKEGNSKSKQKEIHKCSFCKKDSNEVFKCHHQECNFAAHIPCLLKHRYDHNSYTDITFNLLNETIGSFRVKNNDFVKKNAQHLRGMEMLDKSKKSIPYLTCQSHSNNIKWCVVCYEFEPADQMAECSRCYRWNHNECFKMKNKNESAYTECNACMDNNYFLQRALFPDQINRMVKIQTAPNKWTRDQIKYMDTFAFKISTEIGNQIIKNKAQFQIYHLQNFLEKEYLMSFESRNSEKQRKVEPIEKTIEKILEKSTQYLKQFHAKKIIEILYFLKYKEYRSRNQINNSRDVNDLRDVYPKKQTQKLKINAQKAVEQEKCKKVLNCLLDCYLKNLKQVELKDIYVKINEFGDYIKRQIAHFKDSITGNSDNKKIKKNQNSKAVIDMLKNRPYRIAQEIRQMLKMISQNKDKFKGKIDIQPQVDDQNNHLEVNAKKPTKNKQNLQNNFLLTLVRCILAKDQGYDTQMFDTEDIIDLIESYRKIIYVSRLPTEKSPRRLTLSDEQFYKILNKSYDVKKTIVSEESKIRIVKYFKSLIKKHNIKELYQIKSEMTEKYDKMMLESDMSYNQTMIMKQNLAQFGVFTDKYSKIMTMEKRSIYFRVLKIKYMKLIRMELETDSELPEFALKPNEKFKKDMIENAKRILEFNNKSIQLTQTQKKNLEFFLVKEEVFTKILNEEKVLGQVLQAYNPTQRNKIQLEGEENNEELRVRGPLTVLERIQRVFRYWMDNHLDNPYHVIKIISPIAEKDIKFPFEYQSAFNDLIESLGERIDMLLKLSDQYNPSYHNTHKVNSDEFMKLWKLIEYAQLENTFENLRILSVQYKEWISELEQRYNPINKTLEDRFLNTELLGVIDKKISDADNFPIDLKTEVKKLKIVKLWALLSDKLQTDFEKKPTINAIQQFRILMNKVNYPRNAIYKLVTELEIYGRTINERIEKYLKKQKSEDLEYYEELNLLNSKMPLRQAEELKIQLQNAKLDVTGEISSLEDEIASFYEIPSKLEPYLKKENNLEELIRIKTKILQSPIRYENLDTYCQLYHRICFLKCQTIEGNINRKEFLRLLNTSQLGALILTERFPVLLKAYRQIERAQKQLSSQKLNHDNLLPLDNKKLKQDLANDPLTLAQIEKLYQRSNSLRDKFKIFKINKELYDRYVVLESELSRLPIYYKDVQGQIHRMKNQLGTLYDRAMMLKKNFNPRQAKEIVASYNRQGIKHQELQSIKKVNQAYNICMSLSEKQQDYVEFSQKCKEYTELDSIITLNEIRNQLFSQYSEEILEQKAEAGSEDRFNINFLNALINEGAFLLKHVIAAGRQNTQIRQKTLTALLKINQKIHDMTKTSSGAPKNKKSKRLNENDSNVDRWQDEYDSAEFDQDRSGQDEDGYDDEDEDEMEDYDDEDEMEDYDYDEDEESVPPPKKRAQPMVMEISDEDDEPVAEPRKVVHQNPMVDKQEVNEIIQQSQEAQNGNSSDK